MRLGYLGLGSNVGDRRANLQAAVEDLWTHDVVVLASSSVYETEPVGEVLDQREFYNACVRIETPLEPEALLDACKAVERALGREPGGVRHGPRPIDVDVLLLEDVEHESERLRLPHREVTTRRFVLVPLLELDPDLELPGGGRAPMRSPRSARARRCAGPGRRWTCGVRVLLVAGGAGAGRRACRRGDLLRRRRARPRASDRPSARRRALRRPRPSPASTRSGSAGAPRRAPSPTPAASRCGSSAPAARRPCSRGRSISGRTGPRSRR